MALKLIREKGTTEEEILRIANRERVLGIVKENGKVRVIGNGVNYLSVNGEYGSVLEAILVADTRKTQLAIKRALKKAERILEDETEIRRTCPTADERLLFKIMDYRKRQQCTKRAIEIIRTLRPRTATIGMAECFDQTCSEVYIGSFRDEFYRNLTTKFISQYVPVAGTPVIRIGYGLDNDTKYSDKKEYLYIKL